MKATAKDRLFNHSEHNWATNCRMWNGAIRDGYGMVWHKGRLVSAHRLSWEIYCGEIPRGMQVLHRCDNRKCINPVHLFLGSQKNNIQDAISKGRYDAAKYGRMTGKVRNERGQFIKLVTL